ncbi:ABC transporter substrate-binding protein [Gluconobacter sp. LMG 1744]|uniref:ABC transporter substrate-binding protein n=1 Tax=Gluconobacter cadivus TaxID=2728101 RepID=A0ABR9YRU8_9PROT|nr:MULTISPECIES: ABC transporter substrate-binding protein [Gluconobacter]MBF0887250.1 ABC transporter substrate-binding protein [Gluconobacter cadivus]MBF0890509.1 ABC transporter substrate-binding protein [Gluconobacter cadivus]MBS1059319.1 ABC transporter substrate-binding protein [Gluconobacter sp. Dm-44]MBS1074114.1 ABC transporter substrate-binding protein [Gluconobacter sp. Dm-73]MBS1091404.1 ABC transporter substrate-binding protein [Gluconobacter sp. Dm-74]
MFNVFSRRTILGAVVSLAVATGAAHANPATDFVNSFGGRLAGVVNSKEPLEQKKKEVLPLLKENVDIAGIGRYCLGKYWRTATQAQRDKYLSLFDQVLVNTITDQIGSYQGVSFRVTSTTTTPEGERVNALIDRPGQPEVNMQLVIGGNPPKVMDMYGEGASLRMNQRGDYSSYLARHNGDVDALNAALERQLSAHK